MTQQDVIDWLREKEYLNKWFTTSEIKKGLKEKGFSNGTIGGVHKNLIKLWMCNVVEFKGKSLLDRDKIWRLKFE